MKPTKRWVGVIVYIPVLLIWCATATLPILVWFFTLGRIWKPLGISDKIEAWHMKLLGW